jgi:hypothetical protein
MLQSLLLFRAPLGMLQWLALLLDLEACCLCVALVLCLHLCWPRLALVMLMPFLWLHSAQSHLLALLDHLFACCHFLCVAICFPLSMGLIVSVAVLLGEGTLSKPCGTSPTEVLAGPGAAGPDGRLGGGGSGGAGGGY